MSTLFLHFLDAIPWLRPLCGTIFIVDFVHRLRVDVALPLPTFLPTIVPAWFVQAVWLAEYGFFLAAFLSFAVSMYKPAHGVPEEWRIRPGVCRLRRSDGEPRWCKTCRHFKPDRAHHCHKCDRCVLRRDTHESMLGTCTGHGNYKAWVLTWIYMTLSAACALAADLMRFCNSYFVDESFTADWSILAQFVFGLVPFCFALQVAAVHTVLISNNRTMVERRASNDKPYVVIIGDDVPESKRPSAFNTWSCSVGENWCAVLGENMIAWPFPWAVGSVYGDGLEFPLGNIGGGETA